VRGDDLSEIDQSFDGIKAWLQALLDESDYDIVEAMCGHAAKCIGNQDAIDHNFIQVLSGPPGPLR